MSPKVNNQELMTKTRFNLAHGTHAKMGSFNSGTWSFNFQETKFSKHIQTEWREEKKRRTFSLVVKRKWREEGTRQWHSYMEGINATPTVSLRFLDDHSAHAIIYNYNFRTTLLKQGKYPEKWRKINEKKKERMVTTAERNHLSTNFSGAKKQGTWHRERK